MNRYLVDTHVLLWWLADDRSLSARAREALSDRESETLVSVVSLWEMAIKRRLGKLQTPDDLPDTIAEQGFGWLGVEPEHAWSIDSLPDHHSDPFDRMLIAQAIAEDLKIITADPHFGSYEVEVCW